MWTATKGGGGIGIGPACPEEPTTRRRFHHKRIRRGREKQEGNCHLDLWYKKFSCTTDLVYELIYHHGINFCLDHWPAPFAKRRKRCLSRMCLKEGPPRRRRSISLERLSMASDWHTRWVGCNFMVGAPRRRPARLPCLDWISSLRRLWAKLRFFMMGEE